MMTTSMEKVQCNGQMVMSTRVIGKKVKRTEKVQWNGQMVITMKVIGFTTSSTVLGLKFLLMAKFTAAIGKKTNDTVRAN
jgi:hypothetical protein